MKKTQLRFESIQQVVGGEGMAVILLTDMDREYAMSVVCDEAMAYQITLRLNNAQQCSNMLPETLVKLLSGRYELMIFGIYDGQYQVVLMDEYGNSKRMRMTDAVLLSLISNIPMFIEGTLMAKQCVPFNENAMGIAIPINTMDVARLKVALEHAVDEENYELASQLRDEINKRSNSQE